MDEQNFPVYLNRIQTDIGNINNCLILDVVLLPEPDVILF